MQPEMMPPQGGEDEQMVDGIIAAVSQLLQVAGPEWTMEFLQGGLEAAQQGGGQEQPMPQGGMPPQAAPPPPGAPMPEMMSAGGPASMGKIPPIRSGLGG